MAIGGTESALGVAIAATVTAQGVGNTSPITPTQLQTMWTAISKDIIDHFIANAVVPSTGTVNSGAGAGGSTSSSGTIT